MDKDKFLADVRGQFEDVALDTINLETDFKAVETWDSLTATCIQVLIEEDYGVKLSNEELRGATTILDLYELVSSRKDNE
jgi:acyl carrier protein